METSASFEARSAPLPYPTSSIGVSYLQVWVDGVKYFTEHETGTSTVRLMNNHIYLANGKHSVTMIEKESDGTSIKKTVNITIVAQP